MEGVPIKHNKHSVFMHMYIVFTAEYLHVHAVLCQCKEEYHIHTIMVPVKNISIMLHELSLLYTCIFLLPIYVYFCFNADDYGDRAAD